MADTQSTLVENSHGAQAHGGQLVPYCGVCGLPPEYCEYGTQIKECMEWLKSYDEQEYDRLYNEEILRQNLQILSVEERKRITKDALKAAKKSETQHNAKESKSGSVGVSSTGGNTGNSKKKSEPNKVQVCKTKRGRHKFVTFVWGFNRSRSFTVDMKKAAREIGKRFATGTSVTKRTDGLGEEILVQGELAKELIDFMLEKPEVFGELSQSDFEVTDA